MLILAQRWEKERGTWRHTSLPSKLKTWKSHTSLPFTSHFWLEFCHIITSSCTGSYVAMSSAKINRFSYWRGESRYWETICCSDSPCPDTNLPSQTHFPQPLCMFCLSCSGLHFILQCNKVSWFFSSFTLITLYCTLDAFLLGYMGTVRWERERKISCLNQYIFVCG